MTHPSPRFRNLAQLTAYASCLCLGLAFACGGTTQNDTDDEATNGPTTDAGPTNSGPTNSGPTNSGPTTGTTTGTTGGGNGGGGTTGDDCPSVEPAAGSGCSENAQICVYANCTAPDYRDAHTLSCSQGAWQLTAEDACDDVPTTCPPNVYRGAACDVPEGTGPCTVVDACSMLRDTYCTNGVWEYGGSNSEDAAPIPNPTTDGASMGAAATATTSPRPAPQCPEVAPLLGAACCPADYPSYCDYSESGSDAAFGTGPGSFTVVSTGAGGTGADPAPPLTCATCSADMIWQTSVDCP